MAQTIICPNCGTSIDLDKLADEKYSQKLREQEQKLRAEQEKLREDFEKEKEKEREQMRKKAQEFAKKKAEEAKKEMELEMKDKNEQLEKLQKERDEARKKELEYMKKERELADKEKNIELEMEKKLMEERKKIEQETQKKIDESNAKKWEEKMEKIQEEYRKKEAESFKQQEQMKKTIDDLKRKAEQGSQQIQGDISENELKETLQNAFVYDEITDVPTGIKGADLLQNVKNNFGQPMGIIVWESKNTKAWSDSWVMKLKEDSLKVNGNISILVTSVLPKDMKHFGMYDDIMVCLPEYALAVGTMLRDKIISLGKLAKSFEGKDVKMELLYNYLMSKEFSSKINMMVDVFANLKNGIDAERRSMERNWKRREKDLERATFAVTGMYGELESLMGVNLPGAERLELDSGEEEFEDE